MRALITLEQFRMLLPLASEWAAEEERRIILTGEVLSASQLADAREVGVSHPERVRLLHVPEIPMPEHPALRQAAELTQLISPRTAGLTLRYGIFVRSDHRSDRRLIAHELAHTAQYERLGGFDPFLRKYLWECIDIGYPEAPMEQEAVTAAARISGT